MHPLALDPARQHEIRRFVAEVIARTPSESDTRFAEQVRDRGAEVLPEIAVQLATTPATAVLVDGVPEFDTVAGTKVFALLLADAVGHLTAYADFNGSVLTDIRPNPASREQNAQPERLGMHNDFPFIGDKTRPTYVVLVAHRTAGPVPKTLLAAADEIVATLDPEAVELLQQPRYTATVGTKLAWPEPQQFHFPLLVRHPDAWRILYHFDTIATDPRLDEADFARFDAARLALGRAADEFGLRDGHALRQGEALIVPNDHYLHGRESMDLDSSDRLIFRSYATRRSVRDPWDSFMLALVDG